MVRSATVALAYIALIMRHRPGSDRSPSRGTLLVLTLGPVGESERHPLLPTRLRGLEQDLRSRLLDGVIEAGRQCELALEVAAGRDLELDGDVHLSRQRGDGFGERLVNALRAARQARGAAPLIVVGSDVPELSASHLERALELLEERPDSVVLGPSPDGGIYLLATRQPLDDVLGDVRWCHPRTRRDLVRHLRRAGLAVQLMTSLADLDRPSDLHRWMGRVTGRADWKRVVRALLAVIRQLLRIRPAPTLALFRAPCMPARPERGPPAAPTVV